MASPFEFQPHSRDRSNGRQIAISEFGIESPVLESAGRSNCNRHVSGLKLSLNEAYGMHGSQMQKD